MLPIFLILFAFSCNWIYLSVLNLELTEVVMGSLWLWNVLLKFFLQSFWKSDCTAVQSLSCVQLFVTPWTAVHQASLSFTMPQSLLQLMSIELVMPSNHQTFFYMILKRKHYVVDIILGKRYKQLLFFLLQSVIRFAFFFQPLDGP